jgi:uncharacterized LabA/DUF88 family protein
MVKHKDQRVGVFIDVQNLYHSSKNIFQARVNYRELIKSLVGNRKLIRAIGYVVKTESTSGEDSFFEALEKTGVELRMKDIQIFPGGVKKADWDVGMAVDAIRMADFLDTVILVTGDGDFIPLVEYLKWGKGRMVEVAAFTRSSSAKLKEAADEFINLENIPNVIMTSKKAEKNSRRTPDGKLEENL